VERNRGGGIALIVGGANRSRRHAKAEQKCEQRLGLGRA
jgi:hypothetical protein